MKTTDSLNLINLMRLLGSRIGCSVTLILQDDCSGHVRIFGSTDAPVLFTFISLDELFALLTEYR